MDIRDIFRYKTIPKTYLKFLCIIIIGLDPNCRLYDS